MFYKKYTENLIYFFSFISLIIFFLYTKNSLFSHWSDILDQDVTLIYNSLLVGSDIPQEYLDHPAYTTFFVLSFFFKIGYLFNITDIKNIDDLLNHSNKNDTLQIIHNISQFVHLTYSVILILIFKKILHRIIDDNFSSFLLSIIFLISPSYIFLFELIRSEILSLIFIFLFYINLENCLKKNFYNIIFSGIFFICALLSKIQVILCLFPLLIIFFINSLKIQNYKIIRVPNKISFFLNILIIVFLIAIVDNYFYKRIDKIFFILVVFTFIFAFSISEKKITGQHNTNITLLFFFLGCSIAVIFFKLLSKLEFTSFHPALIDIITSPISQMSNISTGYKIGRSDNFEYIFKIKDFFFSVRDVWGIKTISFLLDKFNIFVYFSSCLFIFYFLSKKEYLKSILLFILNISIITIILIFNFRPYHFYDIYILPFNLILISILINKIYYKKIICFIIFFIYFGFNVSNIDAMLDMRRVSGIFDNKDNPKSNMQIICLKENILNKYSYMRYWHHMYDEAFLNDLCSSYFKKISRNLL